MQNYEDLLETGYRLVELEQHGEALQAFRQAAELRPEEKEPLVQLALLFQQLGDPEGAIGLLLKASDLDPQNAYILLNLGLIHYDEERRDDAARYLKAAVLVIDRGTAETRRQLAGEPHEKRAAILFQCDELEQTAAEAREMIAEIARQDAASHRDSPDPTVSSSGVDDVEALLELGTEHQDQGRFQEAAAQYRRVLRIDPHDFRAHLKLACCLNIEGLREEALVHISRGEAVLEDKLRYITSALASPEADENDEANSIIRDLKELLSQASEIRDGIKLRLMFSEASTRKITRQQVEQFLPAVREGERMRIGVLITLWKRPGLADLVLSRCKSIKEKLSPLLDLEVMVVGSEGEASRVLAAANGFEYLECDNDPLGAKYNAGLRVLKDRDVDAVVLVGSDDFVDHRLFGIYAAGLRAGYALLGILDMYLFDLENLRTCYWPGYGPKGGRQGESLGLGRCISRPLLDQVNWTLWDDALNRRLDGSMIERLAPHLLLSPERFPLGTFSIREHGISAIDVKSDINLWSFDEMVSALQDVHYLQPIAFLDEHFETDEAGRLLAMSEGANRISQLLTNAPERKNLAA